MGVGAGFVWADELNENTNWLCTYEDQGAVITGYVGQITGPLQVPEKLGPYTVRSIGSAASFGETQKGEVTATLYPLGWNILRSADLEPLPAGLYTLRFDIENLFLGDDKAREFDFEIVK